MKLVKFLPSILVIFSFTACNLPSGQQAATATDIQVADTPGGSPTTELALTPTSTDISVVSALEAILISSPGAQSTLVSSVTVTGQSRPTFEQSLVVAIYDENGKKLADTHTTIQSDAGSPGPFSADLSFSVDHQQAGRISVYELSARDSGIQHLSSVEVTLSPTGPADIRPAPISLEEIVIQLPIQLSEVGGGSITISGFSKYFFEATLGLRLCGDGSNSGGAEDQLCGDAHNVLGAGTAMISSTEMGEPGPFSGTLTYSVSAPMQGRIVVFATSARDGGWIHIASIPVTINP